MAKPRVIPSGNNSVTRGGKKTPKITSDLKTQGVATDKSTVADFSIARERMQEKWELITDLLGGTRAMRKKHKWLPKEEAERQIAYENRLARSILYEGLKDTIRKVVAAPFKQEVVIRGNMPAELVSLEEDADNKGMKITSFARELFRDGVGYGMSLFVVDYPRTVTQPNGQPPNLGIERDKNIHPYFCHIKAEDFVGAKFIKDEWGRKNLVEIRWREQDVSGSGEYGEKKIDRVRLMNLTEFQVWEKQDEAEVYKLVDSFPHSFKGNTLPVVPFYTEKDDDFEASPPLEGLAWLNLAHWQSSSDQRNILRIARFAILFQKGVTDEEMDKSVVIGPTHSVRTSNKDGDLKYVEHTGASINAGKIDLDDLQNQMEVMGLQPFVRSTRNATATAMAIDESKGHSNIYDWVRNLEEALLAGYRFAWQWIKGPNVPLPEDLMIDVFSEFGLSIRAQTDIAALAAARASGDLSRKTYLTELRRRAVLDETLDIEQEISDIEAEGPSLADMTNLDANGNPVDPNAPTPPGGGKPNPFDKGKGPKAPANGAAA